MTTIAGNARFRETVAARLVLAMRPDQSIADTAVPDAQSSPDPGDYSIEVDTHQVLLQAHAFDPAKLVGPWRAETIFAAGDVIFETGIDADALVLECTAVTGTEETGATEPTWDTTPGNTTVDNDVTWTALGTISELSPLTQFLYQPVLLSAVNPETGSVDGGTSVSLSGSGLSAFNAGSGDTITVDGNAATNITVASDTEITFDTPASDGGSTGVVDLVVTIGGESVTLSAGFEYTEAAWSPADITTLLWVDDDLTLDGSSNVEQLNDESGNARHFSNATAGERPPTGTLNGLPTVAFNGSDQHLQFNGGVLYAAGDHTVVAIIKMSTSSGEYWFSEGSSSSSNTIYAPGRTGGWPFIRNDGGSIRLNVPSTAPYDNGSWTIWGYEDVQTEFRKFIDAPLSPTATHSYSRSGTLTADRLALGALVRTGGGEIHAPVEVAGIIVFPGTDEATRQRCEGYLAHRRGLAANLPAGHPYKNAPP